MTIRTFLPVALGALLVSCTSDSLETYTNKAEQNKNPKLFLKPVQGAANTSNPYDQAGFLHNQFLDSYAVLSLQNQSLEQIIGTVENIALADNNFTTLSPTGYITVTTTQINSIVKTTLEQVLNNTTLPDAYKKSLENLTDKVVIFDYDQREYNEIYGVIISYESAILTSTLGTQDKKMVLTTTSILRYAAYSESLGRGKGKGRDKDWRLSVGNIAAAASGATESEGKAITMAIITGFYQSYSQ